MLERLLDAQRGGLAPEVARYLLSIEFPETDRARYVELSDRAQDGSITPEQRAELEDYLNANDFVAILKSKARLSLSQRSSAA